MHAVIGMLVVVGTLVTGTPEHADTKAEQAQEVDRPALAAYQKAEWPRPNGRLGTGASFQGRALPRAEDINAWTWITEKPEIRGRVVVLDFWATWCGPCIRASPILDAIQTEHAADLAIIAVGGQREPESRVRSYVEKNPVSYHHAYDSTQRMIRELRVTGIPHVVVVSSDGVVRWQGNPLDGAFRAAVADTLEADPFVAARRAARAAETETPAEAGEAAGPDDS